MPDAKISQLTSATTLDGTELIPVVQGTETVKATVNQVATKVTSGLATVATSGSYADLTGKPSTFAPSAHTHAWADITSGTPTTLAGYGITDAAPSSHVGSGGSAHANVVAGGAAGFMTGADKTKLNGIATGATAYSHPTGDGNSHVPATSTTNNLKVLKAGSTANSAAWGNVAWAEVTSKPTFATVATSGNYSDLTNLPYIPQTAGDIGAADQYSGEIYYPTLVNYQVLVEDVIAVGSTFTLDLNAANVFSITPTAARTIAIANMPAGASTVVILIQNGGAYTLTWPAGMKWASGTAPTLTASGVDIITLLQVTSGGLWYGILSAKDIK